MIKARAAADLEVSLSRRPPCICPSGTMASGNPLSPSHTPPYPYCRSCARFPAQRAAPCLPGQLLCAAAVAVAVPVPDAVPAPEGGPQRDCNCNCTQELRRQGPAHSSGKRVRLLRIPAIYSRVSLPVHPCRLGAYTGCWPFRAPSRHHAGFIAPSVPQQVRPQTAASDSSAMPAPARMRLAARSAPPAAPRYDDGRAPGAIPPLAQQIHIARATGVCFSALCDPCSAGMYKHPEILSF